MKFWNWGPTTIWHNCMSLILKVKKSLHPNGQPRKRLESVVTRSTTVAPQKPWPGGYSARQPGGIQGTRQHGWEAGGRRQRNGGGLAWRRCRPMGPLLKRSKSLQEVVKSSNYVKKSDSKEQCSFCSSNLLLFYLLFLFRTCLNLCRVYMAN